MSSTSEALRGYFDERSEENSLTPWLLRNKKNRKHKKRKKRKYPSPKGDISKL